MKVKKCKIHNCECEGKAILKPKPTSKVDKILEETTGDTQEEYYYNVKLAMREMVEGLNCKSANHYIKVGYNCAIDDVLEMVK